jgi:hypothetical protein
MGAVVAMTISSSSGCGGRFAAAYAASLFRSQAVGFAADRESHRPEPDPHTATKFDLARTGSDRLTLQEKQYEAGVGAVGHSDVPTCGIYARLQHHGQVMAFPSPNVALMGLMREGCEREATICKADLFHIVTENAVRGLDEHSFMLRYCLPPSLFDAGLSNELVNFGHIQIDSELQR